MLIWIILRQSFLHNKHSGTILSNFDRFEINYVAMQQNG